MLLYTKTRLQIGFVCFLRVVRLSCHLATPENLQERSVFVFLFYSYWNFTSAQVSSLDTAWPKDKIFPLEDASVWGHLYRFTRQWLCVSVKCANVLFLFVSICMCMNAHRHVFSKDSRYSDCETFISGPQTLLADPAYLPQQQSVALPFCVLLSHIFSDLFHFSHATFPLFPFHLPSNSSSSSHLLGSIISSSESPGLKPQGAFTPNMVGSMKTYSYVKLPLEPWCKKQQLDLLNYKGWSCLSSSSCKKSGKKLYFFYRSIYIIIFKWFEMQNY